MKSREETLFTAWWNDRQPIAQIHIVTNRQLTREQMIEVKVWIEAAYLQGGLDAIKEIQRNIQEGD